MVQFPVYFFTWTTYGTWLPGDRSGWVDGQDASPVTPIKAPDPRREQFARSRMKAAPVLLSSEQRGLIDKAIREIVQFRRRQLHAVNVRTNHVHVVVECPEVEAERAMGQIKAKASRHLNELCRRWGKPPPVKWWTRHGSTRYLNTQHALERAIRDVQEQ